VTVPPLAETVAAFDARAAAYDRSRMHQLVAARAVAAARPQQGQTLLDLAGGTGLVARAALPHGITAIVVDASPGMLRQARSQEPRLRVVRADAHHLPLRRESVDLVTCVTALHLFARPEQALREAARVCRPDGRIVFTTWAVHGWSTGRALREAAEQEGLTLPDPFADSGTWEAAARLAQQSGLLVEQVVDVRTKEPLEDREQAWHHVTRSHPEASTDAIRRRFAHSLPDHVEHALLLLTCRPQTSSPSR
jgi:ubiquinone/menaquinone biosynthesis C-methylase UbiE